MAPDSDREPGPALTAPQGRREATHPEQSKKHKKRESKNLTTDPLHEDFPLPMLLYKPQTWLYVKGNPAWDPALPRDALPSRQAV